MLARLDPADSTGSRSRSAGLTKDAVRALAREAAARRGQAREPGPLLRRRPRRARVPAAPRRPAPAPPGRDRRPPGHGARPPRGPAQLHGRPAPRPGRGGPGAALRAREGREDATASSWARRRRSRPRASRSRTPAFTARRRKSRPSGCATTRSSLLPVHVRRDGGTRARARRAGQRESHPGSSPA